MANLTPISSVPLMALSGYYNLSLSSHHAFGFGLIFPAGVKNAKPQFTKHKMTGSICTGFEMPEGNFI